MLVDKGAGLNEQDETGMTPMHYAALSNNYEGTVLLLKYPKCNLEVNTVFKYLK